MNMHTLVNPLIMWGVVTIGAVSAFIGLTDKPVLDKNVWSIVILIITIVIWIYLSSNALKSHRKASSSVDAINYLAKGGIYNVIRHPMYVGDIILAWGLFFFYPTEQVLASVVWLTVILYIWMKLEERALLQKFGIEYETYIEEVPMVLPVVKKQRNK